MKQKIRTNKLQNGFTIIELLVVISIIVVLSTIVVIDFNRQRTQRSVVIAKNETVTNIRKVQGYMLSSRNIAPNLPAKFYIVTIGDGATSYRVEAIDSQYGFTVPPIETIQLPSGIRFSSVSIAPPTSKESPTSYKCIQIIFSAPYGKMYARGAATCDSTIVATVQDPVLLSQLNEREVIIELGNESGELGHSIVVTPITGLVTPL